MLIRNRRKEEKLELKKERELKEKRDTFDFEKYKDVTRYYRKKLND